MDHLVRLHQEIIDGFVLKEYTVCIFFDIQKAFDRLNPSTIISQLKQWNIQGNLLKFIEEFLNNQTFKVRVGTSFSDQYCQELGTPQGSVLSPLLFIIAITGLRGIIKPPLQYLLFADDLAIYLRGPNLKQIESKLQKTINALQKWSAITGLHFSTEKTKMMIFHRKHNSPQISINLYGDPIEITNQMKFLGVIFENKLTFKGHINNLKARANLSLNIIKKISGTNWGADRQSMLRVYSSHIRSKLDYGSIIYNSAKDCELNRLRSIQNQALRLSLGAFRTSPVKSLHAEANVLPLHLRRMQLCLQYYAKLSQFHQHPTYYKTFHSPLKNLYGHTLPLGIKCENYLQTLDIELEDLQVNPQTLPPWLASSSPSYQNNNLTKFSKEIKIKIQEIAQLEWTNTVNNKLRTIKPILKTWKTSCRKSRKEEVILSRLRIGHSNLTHLKIITEKILPACDVCNVTLSTHHILINCEKFETIRQETINQLINIEDLLGDDEVCVGLVLTFLKKTGLYKLI